MVQQAVVAELQDRLSTSRHCVQQIGSCEITLNIHCLQHCARCEDHVSIALGFQIEKNSFNSSQSFNSPPLRSGSSFPLFSLSLLHCFPLILFIYLYKSATEGRLAIAIYVQVSQVNDCLQEKDFVLIDPTTTLLSSILCNECYYLLKTLHSLFFFC